MYLRKEYRIKENISTEHVQLFVENIYTLQEIMHIKGVDIEIFLGFMSAMNQDNIVVVSMKYIAEQSGYSVYTVYNWLKILRNVELLRKAKTPNVYMVNPFIAVKCSEDKIAELQSRWHKFMLEKFTIVSSTEESSNNKEE